MRCRTAQSARNHSPVKRTEAQTLACMLNTPRNAAERQTRRLPCMQSNQQHPYCSQQERVAHNSMHDACKAPNSTQNPSRAAKHADIVHAHMHAKHPISPILLPRDPTHRHCACHMHATHLATPILHPRDKPTNNMHIACTHACTYACKAPSNTHTAPDKIRLQVTAGTIACQAPSNTQHPSQTAKHADDVHAHMLAKKSPKMLPSGKARREYAYEHMHTKHLATPTKHPRGHTHTHTH
jgi:hypothetical protein